MTGKIEENGNDVEVRKEKTKTPEKKGDAIEIKQFFQRLLISLQEGNEIID